MSNACQKVSPPGQKFVSSQLKKNRLKKNQGSWLRLWCQYGVRSPNIFLSSVQHTEFGTLRNGGDGYEKRISKNTQLLVKEKKILLTFFKEFFSKYRKRPESKEGVP